MIFSLFFRVIKPPIPPPPLPPPAFFPIAHTEMTNYSFWIRKTSAANFMPFAPKKRRCCSVLRQRSCVEACFIRAYFFFALQEIFRREAASFSCDSPPFLSPPPPPFPPPFCSSFYLPHQKQHMCGYLCSAVTIAETPF